MAADKTLNATVTGKVKWDNDRPFRVNLRFTVTHMENTYGTGNYILMEAPNEKNFEPQSYDVRYVGTSDIKKLARIAAETFFGSNMTKFEVAK